MHKPLDENTICLNQIVDLLSNYIPTNVQQLSSRKFPFIWDIDIVGNHQTLNQQLQMIITFDPLIPTFFGALESSHQGAPFHTIHSQFGHTTKEQDHKTPIV